MQCPEDYILREPHWKKKKGDPSNIRNHTSMIQLTLVLDKLCFICISILLLALTEDTALV